jgi:2-succinyl-5-enolpyruvyl-6-hydroxy-3-cyclohexene-1-carboxylate synthase
VVHQAIRDIAQLCFQAGIRKFVISPGSRSAPLTLAVARHSGLETTVVPDERSAGFIALGMAQATGQPVGLICTSGTAAYNYAPAVAEAYFLQIPLLILTADRPPEWIGQLDGQTIFQQELFGKHVKAFYQLPDSFANLDQVWHVHRQVNEAISVTQSGVPGPVHLNVPFREPFYPVANTPWNYRELPPYEVWEGNNQLSAKHWQTLATDWERYNRKLIVAGQAWPDTNFTDNIGKLARIEKIPLLADLLSNLHSLDGAIRQHDSFLLNREAWADLQPDLLITYGNSVISKSVKQFLRAKPAVTHWHIQAEGLVADPFQSVKRIIRMQPAEFFMQLLNRHIRSVDQTQAQYRKKWFQLEEDARQRIPDWMQQDINWSELVAVYYLLQNIEENAVLHVANSTSVRYASWVGLPAKLRNLSLYANRGTSGIDGCTSTALGYAMCTQRPVYLITGDVAFFYDRNAFWGHRVPRNLKVILLNNHAGGIFRLINGPAQQAELEEFFETEQPLNAKHLAEESEIKYFYCENKDTFKNSLSDFIAYENTAILELRTDSKNNAEHFKNFKSLWDNA